MPGAIESLAVDTWGVDFGLLAADGSLLGLPFAYRDRRNVAGHGGLSSKLVPRDRLYERDRHPVPAVQLALPAPGPGRATTPRCSTPPTACCSCPTCSPISCPAAKINEATIASTSQLIDPRTSELGRRSLRRRWALPPTLLRPAARARERSSGRSCPRSPAETGCRDDPRRRHGQPRHGLGRRRRPGRGPATGPTSARGPGRSSASRRRAPLITPKTRALNFTNEGGVGGTVRFLKNVTGLWLVQRCRKAWTPDRPVELRRPASGWPRTRPPFARLHRSRRARISSIPTDMPEAIRRLLPPDRPDAARDARAAIIRCVLESLALKYRLVLDELGLGLGRAHRQDPRHRRRQPATALLCQFTADATGRPVVAGPAEATALGNILVQAMALGLVGSLERSPRASSAASFPLETYEPRPTAAWDAAYARFRGSSNSQPARRDRLMRSDAAVEKSYRSARDAYAELGVDTEKALDTPGRDPALAPLLAGRRRRRLRDAPAARSPDGGLQVTGNYPGKARTVDELRADLGAGLLPHPGPPPR